MVSFQDLQELGLLKETIVQKAWRYRTHDSKVVTPPTTTNNNLTTHISCHIMSYHVIYIYTCYFGGRHHISCSMPLCVSKSIQTSTRSPMIRPNGGRSANSRVHLNGFNRSSLAKLQRSQHFSNISWSGKNSEMTAVKLFQSKTMDKQIAIPVQTLWPIFVPFRLFFGVKQSWLLELCACDKASFQPGERPGRFPQRAWGQGHRSRGTAVCSCQCSKACSSQRWQGKVEKIDQLERDIQTARDFSGNWSMHQETHGPYVKSLCIMQRTKILILHWSWFCVRPFIILVNWCQL